ncbi:hypothetical protein CEXT_698441 [Caerostris extrusa]|uniref:Uncharacterized protein n=1 Tax=Caerostris extrusa TaxID=172846 RepID=A0AAV4VTG2_CAEEX|nr:hypothetical protein CEXT_698441 [Caerostris extrusa]
MRGDEYNMHPQDSPTRGRSPTTSGPTSQTGSPDLLLGGAETTAPNTTLRALTEDPAAQAPSKRPPLATIITAWASTHNRSTALAAQARPSAHSLPLRGVRGSPAAPHAEPALPPALRRALRGENQLPSQVHSPMPQHRGVLSVMNFPRLNPSPTHMPKLQMPPLWRDRTSTYLETQCPPLVGPSGKVAACQVTSKG